MQPTSGDLALSPATSRSSYEHRRLDTFTTRRLSAAIDALRLEGESILWEMNSLRTQISTLEQRIIGQTEELEMISRNLTALREQHRIMEQQYQEKLQTLRSELRAAQDGRPSTSAQLTNALASECERRRSLSFPESPQPLGNQHSHRHSIAQPSSPFLPNNLVPMSPVVHRERMQHIAEDRGTDMHPATFQHSSTPPPSALLHPSSRHSPYDLQRLSPHRNYKQSRTFPHDRHDPQRNAVQASPTRHEPSLSPTLVGSCSDGPSHSRTPKHHHKF